MRWQYSPYTLPLLLVGALSTSLALYAWLRRRTPGAKTFALMVLALAQWAFSYALQNAGADLPSQLFWARLKYVGIVVTPAAWLCLTLQYTGRSHWVTRRNLALLAVHPLVTWVLVWTNHGNGPFWMETSLDTSAGFAVLVGRFGSLFWFHTAYAYLLLLAGTILLIQALMRSPVLYRGQARSLLIAVVVPWAANALNLAGFQPFPHLDPTPFALGVTVFSLGWGLFRFGLLDLVPVARDAVIEGMGDGVIVLDAGARLVDLNPAAERIIGTRAEEALGRPASAVVPGWPGLPRDTGGASLEIRLGEGDTLHEVRTSPVYERPDRVSGWLILLHDVTERKRAEEALRARNVLLSERHRLTQEIHDQLSQIMTGLILQLDAARETLAGRPEACRPYLERAAELARRGIEEARRTLRGLRAPALEAGDLADALLRNTRALIEGTPISVEVANRGQPFPLPAELEKELFRIGQEAVTNALRHGKARRVRIALVYEHTGVRFSIHDDGLGFEPLDDASAAGGLGLSGIWRRVSDQHGTFNVQSRPGEGTTVEVFIPRHWEGD